jgi:hypothetical protein
VIELQAEQRDHGYLDVPAVKLEIANPTSTPPRVCHEGQL